jgi:hypothetical protein
MLMNRKVMYCSHRSIKTQQLDLSNSNFRRLYIGIAIHKLPVTAPCSRFNRKILVFALIQIDVYLVPQSNYETILKRKECSCTAVRLAGTGLHLGLLSKRPLCPHLPLCYARALILRNSLLPLISDDGLISASSPRSLRSFGKF